MIANVASTTLEVELLQFTPRPVVFGGARGAMVPPDFGRSVNPELRLQLQIMPTTLLMAPRIFRPTYVRP